jgi:hypothetical protein
MGMIGANYRQARRTCCVKRLKSIGGEGVRVAKKSSRTVVLGPEHAKLSQWRVKRRVGAASSSGQRTFGEARRWPAEVDREAARRSLGLALPTIENSFFSALVRRARREMRALGALCVG